MNAIGIIGGSVLIILSLVIVLVVTMQDSKQNGLQGLTGGQSDSFLSKNQGKTLDAKLSKLTLILSIVFFCVVIAINLAMRYFK